MEQVEKLLDELDKGILRSDQLQPQILMYLADRSIDHKYKRGEVINRAVRRFGQLALVYWFDEHTEKDYMSSLKRATGLMLAAFSFGQRYSNNPVRYIITNTARSGEELKHSVSYLTALRICLMSPASPAIRQITLDLVVIPFSLPMLVECFQIDMKKVIEIISGNFKKTISGDYLNELSITPYCITLKYLVKHRENTKPLLSYLKQQIMLPINSIHLALHLLPLLEVPEGYSYLSLVGERDKYADVISLITKKLSR